MNFQTNFNEATLIQSKFYIHIVCVKNYIIFVQNI